MGGLLPIPWQVVLRFPFSSAGKPNTMHMRLPAQPMHLARRRSRKVCDDDDHRFDRRCWPILRQNIALWAGQRGMREKAMGNSQKNARRMVVCNSRFPCRATALFPPPMR
jgi:hypothetical protein